MFAISLFYTRMMSFNNSCDNAMSRHTAQLNMGSKQSYWNKLWNNISHSFGYAKLEEEASSPSNDLFIELSCPKLQVDKALHDSNTTLQVVDKMLVKDDGSMQILKTSEDLPWHKKNIGLLFMILSTLSGTLLNLSVKAISKSDERLPILELVIIRGVLGSLITMGMMYFQQINKWMGPPETYKLLFLRGLFAFLALTFHFFALSSLSLGDATILSFCSPIITGFLGSIVLKEKWEKVDQLAGFFSIIGLLFITRPVNYITYSSFSHFYLGNSVTKIME